MYIHHLETRNNERAAIVELKLESKETSGSQLPDSILYPFFTDLINIHSYSYSPSFICSDTKGIGGLTARRQQVTLEMPDSGSAASA